jgi:CBS domain-containing protein
MLVEEVMSEAVSCSEDDTVKTCAEIMREENIGFLPICNRAGEPVGAITDRDLVIRVLAGGRSPDEPVQGFMTREVVACQEGDDVQDAARLMREERKSRVVVCDAEGRLTGIVALMDLTVSASGAEAGETLREIKSDRPSSSP